MRLKLIAVMVAVCVFALCAGAETITVATYNVEHFENHFEAFKLSKTSEAKKDGPLKEIVETLRHSNDEDNWETAQVILDKAFNPDVLVIEEGCSESNL